MTNVISLKAQESLEDLLITYAEHLTDEEATGKIRGLALIGLDVEGEPFFSVLKSVNRMELVGVLESLKLDLLSDGGE
jgi:hypothetical protein